MGSPNTNYAARPAAAQGTNTVEVFSINDFPDPVGGVITLGSTRYEIKGGLINMGTNTIAISGGARCTIAAGDPWSNGLLFSGTGPFITSAGAEVIAFERCNLAVNQTSAFTFLEISGCALVDFETCILENLAVPNFGTIGTIENCVATRFFVGQFLSIANGLLLLNNDFVQVKNAIFTMPNLTGPAVTIANPLLQTKGEILLGENQFGINQPASKMNIDPAANVAMTITDNVGGGAFFTIGSEGTIANMTDKNQNNVSVTSVSQNGIYAQFEFGLGTTVQTGQIAELSGFTNSEYNVTARVTSGGTAGSFITEDIIWVGNDTGSFDAPATEMNSPSHGLSDLDSVNITKTVDYNGGYVVFDSDANNFSVAANFTTDEATGTWASGSLNEKDNRMTVFGNEGQRDGAAQALGEVNNNNLGTTCTNGVYAALVLGTVTDSNITERFTLVDAGAGVYRYDGLEVFDGEVTATLTCIKTGANFVTRFAVSIDGAAPTFATAPYASITVQQTFERQVTVLEPLVLDPGDTVQIMAAGDSSTSPIDVRDFRIFIR